MLIQREFDNTICAALRAAQMAENGKNRLAIFTIFRFRRTDVNSVDCATWLIYLWYPYRCDCLIDY